MAETAADAGKLKIFISWSGKLSEEVALVWHTVLSELFDNALPWMSEKDIGVGTRGLTEIASELADSKFGIIVVTQANQGSQWLNYESGSLAKDVDDEAVRVMPSLVDFHSKSDVTGPLGQFQATLLNKDGVVRILKQVSKAVGVEWSKKQSVFERSWPEYETRFDAARASVAPSRPKSRPEADKIDEILTLVRDNRDHKQTLEAARKMEQANTIRAIQERYIGFHNIGLLREHRESRGNYEEITFVLKDGQDFSPEDLTKFSTDLMIINSGPIKFLTVSEYETSPWFNKLR